MNKADAFRFGLEVESFAVALDEAIDCFSACVFTESQGEQLQKKMVECKSLAEVRLAFFQEKCQ